MPKKFDDMVSKIWASMKGKTNPRTGKPFTKSDAYAVATAQWKKLHGGRAPREMVKDWRILEYYVPIDEAVNLGDDFLIKGVAINETTTRNGVKYIAKELEKAAPTFKGKKVLLDHKNEAMNIVGVVRDAFYNPTEKRIEFEAQIMDKAIQERINDGRITDVSIGARVQDLVENKDEGVMTAVGIEGLEISFVAVPGDPGATLASAMDNSYQIKEMIESSIDDSSGEKEMEEDEEDKNNMERVDEAQITGMEAERKRRGMTPSQFYAAPRDPPSSSALPIFDAAHVRNAMARFNQTKFKSPEERAKAKRKIISAAKKFGINSDNFKKSTESAKKIVVEKEEVIIKLV